MLAHLRRRVIDTLAQVNTVTLATCGPAGLQAHMFPCEARGLRLYLLAPSTSDLLVNLENDANIVATTEGWQLRGQAHVIPFADCPDLALAQRQTAPWSVLIEVIPTRLEIAQPAGWGAAETIDLE